MRSVLILTNPQDIHADLVIREIRGQDARVIRFHPEDFPTKTRMEYHNGEMAVDIPDANIHFQLSEIHSVWYRRPKRPRISGAVSDAVHRRFAEDEATQLIESMYVLLEDRLWVNPFFAARRAQYKLLQASIAQKIGLRMPKTIVTNNPDAARQFIESQKGQVVYKPTKIGLLHESAGTSKLIFTSIVARSDMDRLQNVQFAPCTFQEYIPKSLEIRATVVGKEVFTSEIDSQQSDETRVDWRRGTTTHRPHKLPWDVEQKLLSILHELGLTYGAFDLILTPEGQYVMLEVNPYGQWAFVQGFTKMPIATAMARLLLEE